MQHLEGLVCNDGHANLALQRSKDSVEPLNDKLAVARKPRPARKARDGEKGAPCRARSISRTFLCLRTLVDSIGNALRCHSPAFDIYVPCRCKVSDVSSRQRNYLVSSRVFPHEVFRQYLTVLPSTAAAVGEPDIQSVPQAVFDEGSVKRRQHVKIPLARARCMPASSIQG